MCRGRFFLCLAGWSGGDFVVSIARFAPYLLRDPLALHLFEKVASVGESLRKPTDFRHRAVWSVLFALRCVGLGRCCASVLFRRVCAPFYPSRLGVFFASFVLPRLGVSLAFCISRFVVLHLIPHRAFFAFSSPPCKKRTSSPTGKGSFKQLRLWSYYSLMGVTLT